MKEGVGRNMKVGLEKIGINRFNILVIVLIFVIAVMMLAGNDARAAAFVKKVQGFGPILTGVHTTDGSFVSLSTTENNSCVVRKTSASGKWIWERTLSFQTAEGGFVFMHGIAQTNDGFVLVGWGRLGGYYSDGTAVLVRLRTDGSVRWSKTFGQPAGSEIIFNSVSSTTDGGYIVRGGTDQPSETILVKFTSSGQVLWSKSFKELSDNSHSQPVPDGLILAFEHFYCDPSCEKLTGLRVLKVNDSGQIVWNESLKIKDFELHTLGPASGNGVILAGKSTRNSNDLILVGLDGNGQLNLRAGYSLKNSSTFDISSLVQTSDRGYVTTGTKFDSKTSDNTDGFILRIDANQNLVFHKSFGFSDRNERAWSVFSTADGGFRVFGSSGRKDILVLKLNSNGDVPGCNLLQDLNVEKAVKSPKVTTKNVQIASEVFSLPAPGSIEVLSVATGTTLDTVIKCMFP